MTKTCPRCGARFGCTNPEPGCWCESVPADAGALAAMAARYEDCLCPSCLKVFAAASSGSP